MNPKKFIRLREELGLTQKDIADGIGTTVQTISNWERGASKPKLTFIQTYKITQVLKKDLKELCNLLE